MGKLCELRARAMESEILDVSSWSVNKLTNKSTRNSHLNPESCAKIENYASNPKNESLKLTYKSGNKKLYQKIHKFSLLYDQNETHQWKFFFLLY